MGFAGYPSSAAWSRTSFNGSRPRSSVRQDPIQEIGDEVTVVLPSNGRTRVARRGSTTTDGRYPAPQPHHRAPLPQAYRSARTTRRYTRQYPAPQPHHRAPLPSEYRAAGSMQYRPMFILSRGVGDPDIENMDHEEMVQAFGNGTDNMGVDETIISRFPTGKVRDPQKLPEDARRCAICLEDYGNGDVRMTLPCMHAFHENCCRKWLAQNGKCPFCLRHVTFHE
jgi:Ring finger domain